MVDILDGPRGRFLCAEIEARGLNVHEMSRRSLFALLRTTVDSARYWQEPDDGELELAEPENLNRLRPVADALRAHPATTWWSAPIPAAELVYVRWPRWPEPSSTPRAETLAALDEQRSQTVEAESRARASAPLVPTCPGALSGG